MAEEVVETYDCAAELANLIDTKQIASSIAWAVMDQTKCKPSLTDLLRVYDLLVDKIGEVVNDIYGKKGGDYAR